jgi:hypothetical protein
MAETSRELPSVLIFMLFSREGRMVLKTGYRAGDI